MDIEGDGRSFGGGMSDAVLRGTLGKRDGGGLRKIDTGIGIEADVNVQRSVNHILS